MEVFGIFVHFYPFEYLGFKDEGKKNYRAACIPVKGKWLIVLDVKNTLVDSLFDLFHELTHIFAGHDFENQSKEIEEYAQGVAREVFPAF